MAINPVMTTRTERTRCLHEMPQYLRDMINAKTQAERFEIYRAAMRHYPMDAEWDDIAEKAPEWLEPQGRSWPAAINLLRLV